MILIKNGHIKTMAGPELENGCVLIDDEGKIAAVAESVDVPAGCRVIDAQGRLVTPGLVDGHSHIGLTSEDYLPSHSNESSDPLTPQVRAIDAINPQDSAFPIALRGGVTAACTGPGSANIIGGTFAVIKLAGKRVDDMIVKFPAAMKCAFGENPTRQYGSTQKKAPKTRMAVASMLREFLFKAKNYAEAKDAGKMPGFDMKMEAMEPVIRGQLPLKIHTHRTDDICTALRIVKEFGLKATLDHCTEGALIAEELGQEGIPIFMGPTFGKRSKQELGGKSFATAGILHKAGCKVCIISDGPGVIPMQYLGMYAGISAVEGLPVEEAWRGITIYPAQVLGVADRIGSLEQGKDADVVIWTADPLTTVGAKAYMTFVDGKIVYQQ